MSHTMNIQMEIHDFEALERACERLGLKHGIGAYHFFSTRPEVGHAVFLEGWRYPVVVKDDGSVSYDNYNGSWGDIGKLHELEAVYGIEKSIGEAVMKGYLTQETAEGDELVLKITIPE